MTQEQCHSLQHLLTVAGPTAFGILLDPNHIPLELEISLPSRRSRNSGARPLDKSRGGYFSTGDRFGWLAQRVTLWVSDLSKSSFSIGFIRLIFFPPGGIKSACRQTIPLFAEFHAALILDRQGYRGAVDINKG